jgi:hypothetical protein
MYFLQTRDGVSNIFCLYFVTVTSGRTILGLKSELLAPSEMPQIEMLPKAMDASFRKCYQRLFLFPRLDPV